MATGPISSRQIDEETMETVRDFIFLGSDDDCSLEIKKRLLLGRKVMTNLDSLLTFLVAQGVKHLLAMRETRV